MQSMSVQTQIRKTDDAATRQFAIEAARLAANTRCHNVVLMDVRGISPVTDYMILATGTSPRQMRTVCDDLEEWAGERGVRAFNSDGKESGSWMLIDFVDVVVHVFNTESRSFYDLDSLWGDAKLIDWNDQQPAKATE
jgi:ribosome-associated protein